MANLICLGIESTAHTFGVSIIKDEKILVNKRKLYTTKSGGMVPYKVATHHLDNFDILIKDALKETKLKINDIDLISFSQSPGLGHSLRVGSNVAKSLSQINKIPIIGVNHCIAHLEIGRLIHKDCIDPVFLYASGANTQIIAFTQKKYRIFGESLDIGIGNYLDTIARYMGLGFPGGPKIYELSQKFNPKIHKLIKMPYTVKGMDLSFSGLITFIKNKYDSKKYNEIEISYSIQEHLFAMLLEVSERAMAHCNKNELLLGGGVACNLRLQEMANIMCKERNAKCFILPNEYNVDNAAMIAWLGILKYKVTKKSDSIKNLDIYPYLRTDEIDINWRK